MIHSLPVFVFYQDFLVSSRSVAYQLHQLFDRLDPFDLLLQTMVHLYAARLPHNPTTTYRSFVYMEDQIALLVIDKICSVCRYTSFDLGNMSYRSRSFLLHCVLDVVVTTKQKIIKYNKHLLTSK